MADGFHQSIDGSLHFRNDIQGLRAFAVLAVIFNHLELGAFPGGYIGVDVFFVISGYLITNQLTGELSRTGSIALASFYKRRIRRLLPAAIATCTVALMAGFLLSSQEQLEKLSVSGLSSLLSVANLYFWSEVGYFDAEAASKPLLHMWSLGVEEQFYLLWPLLLMLSFRSKKPVYRFGIPVLLGFLSFALNHLWLSTPLPAVFSSWPGFLSNLADPTASVFYLMPFRIFEFAVGAAVAFCPDQNRLRLPPSVSKWMVYAAFGWLVYAITHFDKETIFPYWNGLCVALATGTLIHLGKDSVWLKTLLSFKPLVYVGAISYALYLVHWPLIVYYKEVTGSFGALDKFIVSALTLTAALLLYRYVEQPARYAHGIAGSTEKNNRSLIGVASALGLVALLLVLSPKMDGRIPPHRVTLTNAEWRKIENELYCRDTIPGMPVEIFGCQLNRNKARTIILWGDSHALHLLGGFVNHFPEANIAVAYSSGCVSQSGFQDYVRSSLTDEKTRICIERNRRLMDWLRETDDDYIVLISNAKRDDPARIAALNNAIVGELVQSGHEAWVLGDYIRPKTPMASCMAVPDFFLSDGFLASRCKADALAGALEMAYAKVMREQSIRYIPLHDVQCPENRCRFVDELGRALFRDTHHLSNHGAIHEIGRAASQIQSIAPVLKSVMKPPETNPNPPMTNKGLPDSCQSERTDLCSGNTQ